MHIHILYKCAVHAHKHMHQLCVRTELDDIDRHDITFHDTKRQGTTRNGVMCHDMM